MKKSGSPPILILLDILFIFLFILILNQKKTVQIIIPPEDLFEGAKIVCNKNGINMGYTNNTWKEYISQSTASTIRFKCATQCQELVEVQQYCEGNPIYIYIPDHIHAVVGKISYYINSLNQDSTNVIISIKADGTIDKDALLENYPFLKGSFYL